MFVKFFYNYESKKVQHLTEHEFQAEAMKSKVQAKLGLTPKESLIKGDWSILPLAVFEKKFKGKSQETKPQVPPADTGTDSNKSKDGK